MSRKRYDNVRANYFKRAGQLRERKRCRPSSLHLSADDVRRVVNFITGYADDYGMPLPGRHPSHRNFDQRLLPSSDTKASLYKKYSEAAKMKGMSGIGMFSLKRNFSF